MIRIIFLILCLSLILNSSTSTAQYNYDNVEIELITIGSGAYYWEAFGHTAIRINAPNYDQLFGFGYFDFSEEDFFLKFAKGDMQYFLGADATEYEIEDYKHQGREIIVQKLLLSASQKQQLVEKLLFLSREENRYYHYDYFLNNCTSRIRDILDEITEGDISSQLSTISSNKSWSDLTFPVKNQAWVNIGIAFIYGLPAYYDRSTWQLSVFPEVFANDVKSIQTSSGWNEPYQLLYQPTKQQSQFNAYGFFNTHYAILLCVLILFLGLIFKITRHVTMVFWLGLQSVLGVLALMFWFFSLHSIAAWNLNVLVFFPLAFLLIFEKFKKPLLINGFLVINLLWIISSLFFTHIYFLGFSLINIFIWKVLKS